MTDVSYENSYKLRQAVPGRNSLEVTFPYPVVEKEAKSRGLTVGQFIKKFRAVAQFNGFPGVRYIFREFGEPE